MSRFFIWTTICSRISISFRSLSRIRIRVRRTDSVVRTAGLCQAQRTGPSRISPAAWLSSQWSGRAFSSCPLPRTPFPADPKPGGSAIPSSPIQGLPMSSPSRAGRIFICAPPLPEPRSISGTTSSSATTTWPQVPSRGPEIRYLASHLLSLAARRIQDDWRERFAFAPFSRNLCRVRPVQGHLLH